MENQERKELGVGVDKKSQRPIEFIARTTTEALNELDVYTIGEVMKNKLVRCCNCREYDPEKKMCECHEIQMSGQDFCSYGEWEYIDPEPISVYSTISLWQG